MTLLFSDAHLKPGDAGRSHREGLVDFLRRSRQRYGWKRLVCLGDLFDFWFEYRHACFSGYFDVLRAFASLRDDGVELYLACGNHDFWTGDFLEREIGFSTHRDPFTLPFGPAKAFLFHGDGVDPADRGYRLYRTVARHPLATGLFRLIHPDLAMAIARGVSGGSRKLFSDTNPAMGRQARVLRDHARSLLAEGRADLVACGHAHAPALEAWPTPTGQGVYLNTGDWLREFSAAVWTGERLVLLRREEEIQSLPFPPVPGLAAEA
ncbi:MAG TPA: UDP-2,3-diacylglucosamine diphosphatase [Candidatus Hydrogenedentes bacterium]|nr:UDP-2,3-diacylglucosamine diphosphatase [Candidatus Hydrogenedentota bacterium]HOJ68262.1 UDP-2,3-diacylglucosamine diphosphatase [Candidatus Hydrogenedentota bacterium]HOK88493.1 UDP-2,3-diacylglucosamine diphosphatase [Candidatus Hydrogenedentota bacterium]HOV60366.1 UDP-2,3-diacylglucosamine diphosphatase [Candidatus Hydrogenedentota bacterium]HPO30889.1 UDP-2,3-diacylglucosamine diphosphatase [Candidatus Hydrogenedentota bacterium]